MTRLLAAALVGTAILAGTPATDAAAHGAAASAAASAVATSSTAATSARHCGRVFTGHFARELRRQFPHQRVTASVRDTRTGCWYHLHPKMRITTASVIKAQVLGAVLLQAQDEHRGLSSYERARIHPMIRYSFNNPYVSDLYEHVGGVPGMDRFDRRVGATHTSNTAAYGATVTTAEDRTRISLAMLSGGGPLHAAYRHEAWQYMSHVNPTQRWGITAGVRRGWTVALKNGFYPMSGNGWRVGSTGFVRAPDSHRGYAITVMTDRNTSQYAGIRLVERVTRHVANALSSGPVESRPVDRAVCVKTHAGQSWQSVARRVGLPASQWTRVRHVSGGNPQPLEGQRACSPDLRPRSSS